MSLDDFPEKETLITDPSNFSTYEELETLIEESEFAKNVLFEEKVESFELVECFGYMSFLGYYPKEFNFINLTDLISSEEYEDAIYARRIINSMLKLDLIQRSKNQVDFFLTEEMSRLANRVLYSLDE